MSRIDTFALPLLADVTDNSQSIALRPSNRIAMQGNAWEGWDGVACVKHLLNSQ